MKPQAMKSLSTADLVYQLLVQLGQDCGLHWKDFQTLSTRFRSEGISFITKTLPKLSKAMLAGLGTGRFSCPSNFKRSTRSALPAFLGSLFAKVFSKTGMLLPTACPRSVLLIRQICEIAYKADFPYKEEEEKAVIDRFVAVEEELRDLTIKSDPLLKVANVLAFGLFKDFDRNDLNCKHGPGVTANVSIVDKFVHRLTAGLPSVRSFGDYFFFNENDALTRLHRYPVYENLNYFRSNNCAKVILVPKDSRGPRLISCEPAENQWVQQGIANYMISKLESHEISSGHVNFTDQEINRTLALEHSATQQFSTLDLKDASDRVSLALVDRIFEGLDLLCALHTVRSEFTELPDGRRVRLYKHAPMGSALCFPVMATSIYLIIISGLIGRGLTFDEAKSFVYVYGDDVIVKTEYATYAIDLLERYGLRVNTDKSFIDSPFLESCGQDAFRGNSVNITRVRKCQEANNNPLKKKPETLVSLTMTANLLQASGFRRASEMLFQYSESWLGPLPYGHQESPYLCRWVETHLIDMLPELNYLNPGIRWKSVQNLDYNPLGQVMRAWRVQPAKTYKPAMPRDIYGHFMRIWGSIGSEDPSPRVGEFTLPRQYSLAQRWFDHYSLR